MWVVARYLGLSLATDSRLAEPVDEAALEPHAMVFRVPHFGRARCCVAPLQPRIALHAGEVFAQWHPATREVAGQGLGGANGIRTRDLLHAMQDSNGPQRLSATTLDGLRPTVSTANPLCCKRFSVHAVSLGGTRCAGDRPPRGTATGYVRGYVARHLTRGKFVPRLDWLLSRYEVEVGGGEVERTISQAISKPFVASSWEGWWFLWIERLRRSTNCEAPAGRS